MHMYNMKALSLLFKTVLAKVIFFQKKVTLQGQGQEKKKL